MSLNESIVEDAALEWFGELGYAVGHGPHLAPGEPVAERGSYGEVVLAGRLREAIPLKQPEISRRTFSRSFCPGSHGNWKAWPLAGHFHGHFVRLQKGENGNLTVCSRNSASNFPNMGSSSLLKQIKRFFQERDSNIIESSHGIGRYGGTGYRFGGMPVVRPEIVLGRADLTGCTRNLAPSSRNLPARSGNLSPSSRNLPARSGNLTAWSPHLAWKSPNMGSGSLHLPPSSLHLGLFPYK